MKTLLGLFVISLTTVACGAVTHEELQRELQRTQEELRSDFADGDVASFECSINMGIYARAAQFCENFGGYCNVVETYENHCLRRNGETNDLLPPTRGVTDAVRNATETFNRLMQERQNR